MSTSVLLKVSLYAQLLFCVFVLGTMAARRSFRVFGQLGSLVSFQGLNVAFTLLLLYYRRALGLTSFQAYTAYFWQAWLITGAELILRVLVIRGVFAEAMRPMAGLQSIGKIVFRWVAVVSLLVALALIAGPNVTTNSDSLMQALGRLEQGLSVLTLCLLVFVCFAVRPLGLTFRSHLFGVSLGLGVASTVELVQAAWALARPTQTLYSAPYVLGSAGCCITLMIWGTYFALPEPKRRMILLPTTSPFFFWNRISEILGDAPGHVAIAGFSPDMLAPAEIEMLTAATSQELAAENALLQADAGSDFRAPEVHSVSPLRPDFGSIVNPSLAL